MKFHCLRWLAALLLVGGLAAPSIALQTIDVRDGHSASAKISLTEQTRIKIDRGRISEVLGDIFEPSRNPAGRVALEKDVAAGEIYIRLLDPGLQRPVNLFVKGERGTYGLVLQPVDMPLETVVLRERGDATALPGGSGASAVVQGVSDAPFPKSATHFRAIKAMWLAMVEGTVPRDVAVQPVGREIALWQEARLVLDRVYVANSVVGETYTLTNVSAQTLVVAEPELFRPGVLGIAIREHQLRPGQATSVWVVRARARGE